ncbi:MAG: hypothetical protein KKH94_04555 [Candidatus Omnitrophica bacterium]|nr:hypothetical protein [Candidatus Omnitrophota bacterium]
MAWTEESKKQMDEAAVQAKAELEKHFAIWSAKDLAGWWKRWYLKAGHKRLGRLLVGMAKPEKAEDK